MLLISWFIQNWNIYSIQCFIIKNNFNTKYLYKQYDFFKRVLVLQTQLKVIIYNFIFIKIHKTNPNFLNIILYFIVFIK